MKFVTNLLIQTLAVCTLASCTVPLSDLSAIKATELSFLTTQGDISRICQDKTVRKAGIAGFEMIPDGREAFLIRLAAIEAARRTLDLQYYIWNDDASGTILADRLLSAADRGVKVRLLMDLTTGSQDEVRSSSLAAHPNIETGFFNPVEDLHGIFVGNPIPVIGELDRMQRRMHNKQLIADGSLVIGGGRNLGDEYFAIGRRHNERDLDYVGTGPVVAAAQGCFDLFWGSSMTRLAAPAKQPEKQLKKIRDRLRHKTARLAHQHKFPYPLSLTRDQSLGHIRAVVGRMIWAPYEFVADAPERALQQGRIASPVSESLERTLLSARRQALMHAAYLIPQEGTLQVFRQVTARGVTLELLTNSMASVDAIAAMCGISGRRGDVLDSGAHLWELNVHAASREGYLHTPKLTPMGMHTKALVVDGQVSVIGSYNMDPRSKYINTETCVIIHSPVFAARLSAYLRQDLQPENCWSVTRREEGGFQWSTKVPGQRPETHHRDPDATPSRRFMIWILQKFISEDVL